MLCDDHLPKPGSLDASKDSAKTHSMGIAAPPHSITPFVAATPPATNGYTAGAS